MATSSSDLRLAQHLAAPFALPGRPAKPLSFRLLPEGGMVVISADGRKLWFTLEEVNTARTELGMPVVKPRPAPVKNAKEDPNEVRVYSSPPGKSRDGQSEMIILPPDLKHIEEAVNARLRRS